MNLDQFKNWAVSQGTVAKTNGQYVGECVSLINQYLSKVYGIQAGAWGNAKDWATNGTVAQYFDKVGSPQAGDIGVYTGGTYGHIWIYLNPTTVLEQNGKVSRRVSVNAPIYKASTILRRKGAVAPGGNTMVADKGFLDRVYSAVLQRGRGAGEGENVYLNKDAGWVFNDVYNSGEANVVRAREAQEDATRVAQTQAIADLQKTVNDLKANPSKAELEKAVANAQKLANDLEQANLKIDELKARTPETVDERVVVEGFFKRVWNNLFKK